MFTQACQTNREAIYGLLARRQTRFNNLNVSTGSAFAIAPGVLVTAAHCVLDQNTPGHPAFTEFGVIRAPDIGQVHETASLLAFDEGLDLALLKIGNPRSTAFLKLMDAPPAVGQFCGSFGFPLSSAATNAAGALMHQLLARFQSAAFSAVGNENGAINYETDSAMYKGSSGCPGFVTSGEVFGLHNRSVMETGPNANTRTTISLWVPSTVIRDFAQLHGVLPAQAA